MTPTAPLRNNLEVFAATPRIWTIAAIRWPGIAAALFLALIGFRIFS
jgi:hypothetical protein